MPSNFKFPKAGGTILEYEGPLQFPSWASKRGIIKAVIS